MISKREAGKESWQGWSMKLESETSLFISSQDLFRRQEKEESKAWWEAKDFPDDTDDDDDLDSDVVGETLFSEGNGRKHLSRLDRHDTASEEREVGEETGKGRRADPDIKTTRENNPAQEKVREKHRITIE